MVSSKSRSRHSMRNDPGTPHVQGHRISSVTSCSILLHHLPPHLIGSGMGRALHKPASRFPRPVVVEPRSLSVGEVPIRHAARDWPRPGAADGLSATSGGSPNAKCGETLRGGATAERRAAPQTRSGTLSVLVSTSTKWGGALLCVAKQGATSGDPIPSVQHAGDSSDGGPRPPAPGNGAPPDLAY